jgi:hypothetical protein
LQRSSFWLLNCLIRDERLVKNELPPRKEPQYSSNSSKGMVMYSTKSLSGTPAIQYNGTNVLSVWNHDWTFAFELCELLNELEDHQPELLLTDSDQKWLKKMDRAFKGKVQHA